jgi:hypothetical protein
MALKLPRPQSRGLQAPSTPQYSTLNQYSAAVYTTASTTESLRVLPHFPDPLTVRSPHVSHPLTVNYRIPRTLPHLTTRMTSKLT